ncbi:MAG: type II toxin-antitoxin system Phd/YefM family antitoxin [Chloroflexota bacterium]
MEDIHGHQETIVPAGEFKQRCLALLDRVSETGVSIVVTKRGRAVARVVPIESSMAVLDGSLRTQIEDEEELYSTGETWDTEHAG